MQSIKGGRSRNAGLRRSAGVLLALIFLAQFSTQLCFGQGIPGIPSTMKSPQDIEKWLAGFKYELTLPDSPKTVAETLSDKAGDCDDLAKVVSEALAGLGISSSVVVIKTKGVDMRHAICLWKDENGNYNFFSNKQLVYTGEKSMEGAIQRYFPLYESFSILSPEQLKALATEDREEWGFGRRS